MGGDQIAKGGIFQLAKIIGEKEHVPKLTSENPLGLLTDCVVTNFFKKNVF